MSVCIFETKQIDKAELIKALLDSYQIPCDIKSNDAGGMMPQLHFVQGIQIFVSEYDKNRALEIIKNEK